MSPAVVTREATVVQYVASGFTMTSALCPPTAPFTSTSRGLRARRASSISSQAANSWFVFDMPMESSPMSPADDGRPLASRGTTCAASDSASAACAAGGAFVPLA